MSNNPLQQYFRQPKVFITLPSMGVYNKPGTLNGSPDNMPIFGMTGMDEILLKTPDALLTGESTVKVIQSCCPTITNGWDVSNLDIDALLIAIRIATSGNIMNITHTCAACSTENDYEINVSTFLDHFATCKFDSKVVIGDLVVRLQPLNYKQVTEFQLENFVLQKRLYQSIDITDDEEKNKLLADVYQELAVLQNKIYIASIEKIEMGDNVVTEKPFIQEWVENSDKAVFDQLKKQIERNNNTWKIPKSPIKCETCGAEDSVQLDLDQASFFAGA